MIAWLSRLATRRPRRVLLAASALFLLAVALGTPVAKELGSSGQDFQDPASQYERANDAIKAAIGQTPYYNFVALVSGPHDIASSPAAQRAVAHVTALLASKHGFQRAVDYPSTHSPALLARDRHETMLLAAFANYNDATRAISHVRASIARPAMASAMDGMRVRFGGFALINKELNERTISDLARAELIGLPILLLLSFWFFRGVVAALLPPLVGGLSILLAFLLLRGVEQITPISVFTLNLISGMGLGLGIDYSLFIVYRYREELAAGVSPSEAIARTLATAGRTVLFSCLTVAAAMTCLLAFPIRFLSSMGYGGALVTLSDGAVALLMLPALLMVLGRRIDALSPAWLRRHGARSARPGTDGAWARLAAGVMRRPGIVAASCALVLLAAAIPALHLKFTSPAANLLPVSAESREVEDASVKNFPANAGEADEIVVKGSPAAAARLASEAAATAGVLAHVSAPRLLGRHTWDISALPSSSPYSSSQQRLLSRLRSLAHPYGALVGGAAAYFADQQSSIADHLPLAVLILAFFTAGFLFAMTGSVAIPIKAIVMNMLSISVGAGLIVLIFQDGHLSGFLGFTPIGGLEESSLVLMFVIAFALATDYEVFVLARVKEAHDGGMRNRAAIALGIERTGRIITAAALLFCVAIGVLVTSNLFFTKQLGLGTALAVAIDASVVRALLVPALMALMGRWNWWAPAPLQRLHSRFGLRGQALADALEPVSGSRRG